MTRPSKSSITSHPRGFSAATSLASACCRCGTCKQNEPGVDEIERLLGKRVGTDVMAAQLQMRRPVDKPIPP